MNSRHKLLCSMSPDDFQLTGLSLCHCYICTHARSDPLHDCVCALLKHLLVTGSAPSGNHMPLQACGGISLLQDEEVPLVAPAHSQRVIDIRRVQRPPRAVRRCDRDEAEDAKLRELDADAGLCLRRQVRENLRRTPPSHPSAAEPSARPTEYRATVVAM